MQICTISSAIVPCAVRRPSSHIRAGTTSGSWSRSRCTSWTAKASGKGACWLKAPTLPLPRRARARARVEAGNQKPWPADKVERWAIDRLIPYAKNARTHTDAQLAAIAASIKEWGWTTPALVGEDGGLIAGHARVLAARQLGIAKIPVMVAAGWTEAQKRRSCAHQPDAILRQP